MVFWCGSIRFTRGDISQQAFICCPILLRGMELDCVGTSTPRYKPMCFPRCFLKHWTEVFSIGEQLETACEVHLTGQRRSDSVTEKLALSVAAGLLRAG